MTNKFRKNLENILKFNNQRRGFPQIQIKCLGVRWNSLRDWLQSGDRAGYDESFGDNRQLRKLGLWVVIDEYSLMSHKGRGLWFRGTLTGVDSHRWGVVPGCFVQ